MAQTVLIVDDDDLNREVMEAFLSLNDYAAHVTGTGKRATELAESLLPDGIILDVRLPDISGIEVCRRIRANPKTQHIPILMITGLTGAKIRQEAFDVGVNYYLQRPFDGDDFIAHIDKLLHHEN